MVNQKLRDALVRQYGELCFFDDWSFDGSIIGISDDDRIIYDYDKMCEELARDLNIDIIEAADTVSYDTLRALPYMHNEKRPIVQFSLEEFLEDEENKTNEVHN